MEPCLGADWRRWIARAFIDGSEPSEILAALRAEGAPERIAVRELATIADALAEVGVELRRLELVRRLVAEHAPSAIERRATIDRQEFFDRYFTALRPVLLTRAFDALAARRWTFASLRERFGDATVRVSAARDADPRHYVDPESTYTTMPFASVIDHALAGPSNDLYLVSRNRVLEDALAPLVDDLAPLPDFLAPRPDPRATSIWLGPAGTITPLHHDTSHIVFVQLVGRKRIAIAPPWHGELLRGSITDTFYSALPVGGPGGAASVDASTIEVGPGDALYLPIGTWHHVVALEPSISLSFTAFAWPSVFDWYRPGALTWDAAPPAPAPDRGRPKRTARRARTRRR